MTETNAVRLRIPHCVGRCVCMVSMILGLGGCHLDVTERATVHGDRATVRVTEVYDAEFAQLTANTPSDKFPLQVLLAAGSGWTVLRSTNQGGGHIVTATHETTVADLEKALATSSFSSMTPSDAEHPMIALRRGSLTDTVAVHVVIPRPVRPKGESNLKSIGLDPLANAMMEGTMAILNATVKIHFELSVPGKILSTNGKTTPDGALRWDVPLDRGSTIEATFEEPDGEHIGEASSVLILTIGGAAFLLWSRRRRSMATARDEITAYGDPT